MPEKSGEPSATRPLAVRIAAHVAAPLLAAFIGFVGYHKAFAPLAELAKHGACTVHLPEWLGRLIGWSEVACAALLALPLLFAGARPWRRIACIYFVANQLAAVTTHAFHGELGALPQNAVLIALCLFVLWGDRHGLR